MEIKVISSDGKRKTCPYGASIDFPVGKITRVLVGNPLCRLCPCFVDYHYGEEGIKTDSIECSFPKIRNNEQS